MKASVSPRLIIFFALTSVSALVGRAQDVIVSTDNQRREGQIVSVSGGNVRIKIGPAETGLPLDKVSSVTMAPPAAFTQATATWQKGEAQKTLETLKPLVENFRGLPTNWAEQASALLGEVYLSLGQIPEAEKAFADFTKAYPKAANLANIGLARLAIEKKDFASAKSRLQPIVLEAQKIKIAPEGKNATYGQALYLMGMVQESEGANSEALADYLLVTTLFHEDNAVADKAQARAKALKEKNIIVP